MEDEWLTTGRRTGLLVDANLLVLLVVGQVNPRRIQGFKRTPIFSVDDFNLLQRELSRFSKICTVAHVLAEVSNLTDLKREEFAAARLILKNLIEVIEEPDIPSRQAVRHSLYPRLGLTDAAILTAATVYRYAVLTTDTDLFIALLQQDVSVRNFNHLRGL